MGYTVLVTRDDHTSEGMVFSDKPEYDLNHTHIYIIRPKRMSCFLPRRLEEQVGALAAKLGWGRPSMLRLRGTSRQNPTDMRRKDPWATTLCLGSCMMSPLGEGQARHLVVS